MITACKITGAYEATKNKSPDVIQGPKPETSADNVASTAYLMASDIWKETHKSGPGIDHKIEFVRLVDLCVRALSGRLNGGDKSH